MASSVSIENSSSSGTVARSKSGWATAKDICGRLCDCCSKKMPGDDLSRIFQYIDENSSKFIKNLGEVVAIKNVSCEPSLRGECDRMIKHTKGRLEALGFTTELKDVGTEKVEGKEYPIPNVIFAELGKDPKKLTLLVYGHLDVQPAKESDGWYSDPWKLTERDQCLYGRGSTDDKGPVLGWLHTVEAYQKSNVEIPVNLKFVLESMEEVGSNGLDALLIAEKDKFLKGVDVVTISDNYWLGTEKPCLTYGLRGICYFMVEIECGTKDLHSGVFGGSVREAMPELVWLLSQLVDENGKIMIPGVMDDVAPLADGEHELYTKLDFNLADFQIDAGVKGLLCPGKKEETLMNRWRYPSLSIHGIEGAFSDAGTKTVIPRKVIGKFSIRLVPDQEPEKISNLVKSYLEKLFASRKSPNTLKVWNEHGGRPWTASPKHPNYQAAAAAISTVYKQEPQFTREGGSIPITITLQEVTGRNVLLLPMGKSDDGAHSQNEKIDISNYIQGTKVFAAYLKEIAKQDKATL